jgi:hypothetical protein
MLHQAACAEQMILTSLLWAQTAGAANKALAAAMALKVSLRVEMDKLLNELGRMVMPI